MQAAVDDWESIGPALLKVSERLERGDLTGTFEFAPEKASAPLPRAYQWCEGSCYLVHLERTRASTGRVLPEQLYREPGVWQGTSNYFIDPVQPIAVIDDGWDIDLEPSVAVITGDVPMGTKAKDAHRHIRLVMLLNDLSLRAIQIPEMTKGLGIVQGKPLKVFSPVAVTPEGLGRYWIESMLARPVVVKVNGQTIGTAIANVDYEFDFPTLIEYVARTRDIGAGTIISCGTVANRDPQRGSSCLMERRAVEILSTGRASTPYLKFSDVISIDCFNESGQSIFGEMNNPIVRKMIPGGA